MSRMSQPPDENSMVRVTLCRRQLARRAHRRAEREAVLGRQGEDDHARCRGGPAEDGASDVVTCPWDHGARGAGGTSAAVGRSADGPAWYRLWLGRAGCR